MINDSKMSRAHGEDPLRFLPWALSKMYTLWLSLTYPFGSLGQNFSVHHTCVMNRVKAPQMKFGSSVTLQKDVWLNVILAVAGPPKIIIDDNCEVGARSIISANNCIHLERDVTLDASVLIMDHNHGYEDIDRPIREQSAPKGGRIKIGQGCRIGHAAAIICPRAELNLGAHCVVLPNSLVTLSAPPYSVISGNPARIIGKLDPVKENAIADALVGR
jgi:acetyltransferase-like isoleucine patch superfamily enzyme